LKLLGPYRDCFICF